MKTLGEWSRAKQQEATARGNKTTINKRPPGYCDPPDSPGLHVMRAQPRTLETRGKAPPGGAPPIVRYPNPGIAADALEQLSRITSKTIETLAQEHGFDFCRWNAIDAGRLCDAMARAVRDYERDGRNPGAAVGALEKLKARRHAAGWAA